MLVCSFYSCLKTNDSCLSANKQTHLAEWVSGILQGKIKTGSFLCWDPSANLLFVKWEINCFAIESDFKLVKDCVVTSLSLVQLADLCMWLARQQLPCISPPSSPVTFFILTESCYPVKNWIIYIHHQKKLKSSLPDRPWVASWQIPVFSWGLHFSGPWASLHLKHNWDHWVHVKLNNPNFGCSSLARYFSQLWRPEII